MLGLIVLQFLLICVSAKYHSDIAWQPFPVYGNISVYEKTACQEDATNNLDWLRFDNDQRCINIVSDVDVPKCLYDQLLMNNISYIIRDMNYMINRDVIKLRSNRRYICNFFIVFTQKINLIKNLFTKDRVNFYPFTKIYLFVPKQMIIPNEIITVALQSGLELFGVRNSIFKKSVPYFNLNYRVIKNLYTNKTLNTSENNPTELRKYFGTVLTHPLFDSRQTKTHKLRIALFHCPPYVIIDADKKTFDGVEYQFVTDITRDWDVQFNIIDGKWEDGLQTLTKRENDLAMCSIWIDKQHIKHYDLTSYFSSQCLTMMVPRPKYINEASIIYLSLKSKLWFYTGIAFVAISLMLIGISKIGVSLRLYKRRDVPFYNVARTVIEVINMATAHGLSKFPAQTPIKFVILAWFIFTLLFGVIFSCGYYSVLAQPPISKPIDTVQDFVENNLNWAEYEDDSMSQISQIVQRYNASVFIYLSRTVVNESSWQEREEHIKSGKFGYLVTKLSDKYLANLPWDDHTAKFPLRVMRSCISGYFTSLAFPMQSPYRDFFSSKLEVYHQTGLLWYWFEHIASKDTNIMQYYLKPPIEDEVFEPILLEDVIGAFYLLAFGLTAALIVLLLENMVYKIQLKKPRRIKRRLRFIRN